MALIRWQPAELSDFRRDLDRVFDTFWGGGGQHSPSPTSWSPAVDISETPDAYLVAVEVPGVEKEDVHVTVLENRLFIKGEKKQDTRQDKENSHRVERVYGEFSRSFDLPRAVATEKISADYKNGVLCIAVPKVEEAKPKQIEVSVN